MTDSTQFPSRPVTPAQAAPPREADAEPVRVSRVPDDLKNLRVPVKLRGEVVRQNRDGSVTIKTERGEVDVKPPADLPPPKTGEKVEIELQAGRPPQQATIKPASSATVIKSQQAQTAAPQADAPRPSYTPVSVEVGKAPSSAPLAGSSEYAPPVSKPATTQTLPPEGSVVMARPVSAKEAATLISQAQSATAQTLIDATISAPMESAAYSAQLATAKTASDMLNQILNLTQPAPGSGMSAHNTAQSHSVSAPQDGEKLSPLLKFFQGTAETLLAKLPAPLQAALNQNAPTQAQAPAGPQTVTLSTPVPQAGVQAETQLPVFAAVPGAAPAVETAPSGILPLSALNPGQNLILRIETIAPPEALLEIPAADELPSSPLKAESALKADLRADTKAPEHAPPSSAVNSSAPAPVTLRAVIDGLTPGNLPVMSLFLPQDGGVRHFVLQTPVTDIQPGTQIAITPLAYAPPGGAVAATDGAALASFLTPGAWPALQEAYQTLAQANPALAQAMSNIAPGAASPAQITPAALFFIAAVRGGDFGSWLGEKAIDALRRSERGGGILSRLMQEGGVLSRLSAEPVSQDWRAMPMPMFAQNEMQKMTLYYRHEQDSAEGDKKKGGRTRFIFDLDLSAMGKVQLDGLFHPDPKAARLDLILRTEDSFSQAMQAEMRRVYAKALGQTQVTGELSFQEKLITGLPDHQMTGKNTSSHLVI